MDVVARSEQYGTALVPRKEGSSPSDELIGVYREALEKDREKLLGAKGPVTYYTGISLQHEVTLREVPLLPDIALGRVLDEIAANQAAHQADIGRFLYDATAIPVGERTAENIRALLSEYGIPEGFNTWRLLQDELMGQGQQKIMWGWAWDRNTYYEYDIPHRLQAKDWISFIEEDLEAVFKHIKDVFPADRSTLLSVLGRVIVSAGVDVGLYIRIGQEKVMGPSPATFLISLMDAFERATDIRQRVEEIETAQQIPEEYRHQVRWAAYLLSLPDEAQKQLVGENRLPAILGIIRQLAGVSEQPKYSGGVSLPDSYEERIAYGRGFLDIIGGIKKQAEEFNDQSIAARCADIINRYNERVRQTSTVIDQI